MLRRYESIKASKIFLLAARTHIFKPKILRVMLEQLMRTISIMSTRSHIRICFLPEFCSFMIVILEFRADAIINNHKADIGANMTIP